MGIRVAGGDLSERSGTLVLSIHATLGVAVQEGNMGNEDGSALGFLLGLAIAAFYIYTLWKIFEKAGKPGWAAIIPIYNLIVLLEIVGRPIWWVILFLIPVVSFIISIIVAMDLSKSFGHGALYGLGLAFLGFIFGPILAFGGDTYQGPSVPQQA